MTEFDILVYNCIDKLKSENLTISIAESITGGKLNSVFTDFPNISSVYRGGIIAYQNIIKRRLLDIYDLLTEEDNAVTEDVAKHMAQEVRLKFNTDIGVATTGVAGPNSDKYGNPVGLAYIAVATKDKTFVTKTVPSDFRWIDADYSPIDNRIANQRWVVKEALLLLNDVLNGKYE